MVPALSDTATRAEHVIQQLKKDITHLLHDTLGVGVERTREVGRLFFFKALAPDRVLRIVLVYAPDSRAFPIITISKDCCKGP